MVGKILKGKNIEQHFNDLSLGEFFFTYAEKFTDNICQIDADLDKVETYQCVKTRSVRAAIKLKQLGVTFHDVICNCSYNNLDVSIPILASQFLGAKMANLDPTLSLRNTIHLLLHVKPKVMFVDEASIQLIEDALRGANLRTKIVVFGKSQNYESFQSFVQPCTEEASFKPTKADIHEVALIFFSSGTTGLPKGICHSSYSFLQQTESFIAGGTLTKSVLHFTTFYWISAMMIMCRCFFNGGTRAFARAFKGEHTFKIIEKYKINSSFMPPVYTYELTKTPNIERFDTSSFKILLLGGGNVNAEKFYKLTHVFPNTAIVVAYGLTETGIVANFHPDDDKHFIKSKLGSSGKVIPGILLKVVNPETEELLGPNQKGEIRVKCQGKMIGYYQADSSGSFDQEGFIKTGDIGYYDEDECVYVVGRIKEMFKYKSWHIVPSAIENVLLEHPDIEEAVVFGIPRDEEGEIPAACVVLKEDSNVDKEEIVKFVEERVSDREKLRGGVIFVETLPKTPTGKIIRQEVKNIIKSM